jgi:hypothetical protein
VRRKEHIATESALTKSLEGHCKWTAGCAFVMGLTERSSLDGFDGVRAKGVKKASEGSMTLGFETRKYKYT